MPSLGSIANEAKAILEDIKNITDATKSSNAKIEENTKLIDIHIQQLNANNQLGFQSLFDLLKIQIQIQIQNNQLLHDNNNQNDSIICWLKIISELLCQIKTTSEKQIELEEDMSENLMYIKLIDELSNSEQAIQVKNNINLKKEIDKCCTKDATLPPPCKECDSPKRTVKDIPKANKYDEIKFPTRLKQNDKSS